MLTLTRTTYLFAVLAFLTAFKSDSFKAEQKRYSRVRQAYSDKAEVLKNLLSKKSIDMNQVQLYLRAFKEEQLIELWAKNKSDKVFRLVKEFDVCEKSGKIGPKRHQGDYQVPEGFYHISAFNPYSNFYLSLKVNYPNPSDRILHDKRWGIGGDIYIHGACVTIGCLPLTDDQIKELYVLCVEAKNNGQKTIPITMFPAKLSSENFARISEKHKNDADKIGLWTDLKKGYDFFNEKHLLPSVSFLDNGRHRVTQ